MEVMARRIGTEEFAEQNPAEARERAS